MKIDLLELPLPKEPYRGILPFRLLDWPIFFEREAETQRLTNLVSLYRGVLLYGRSGAGKSSLLNAGLIPHALRQRRAPERIRVYPESGKELFVEPINLQESDAAEHSENEPPRYLPSRFITSTDATDGVRLSCEEFSRTLHDPSDLGRPLLIFDQFEELVTLFEENPKDKEHFEQAHAARVEIEQLLYKLLVSESLPLKLVFAFRDDYFARLTPLFSRIPNLMDQTVRLALPGIEVLRHIVRGPFLPSEERGLPAGHFRDKLGEPDELNEKLADKIESGIRTSQPSGVLNLSEVQTLCLALWQQRKRREELLRADNPAAVLQQIIESTAVASLKSLLPWDRFRTRALLANLVTQEGTRNVVSEENLISETRRNLMRVFPQVGWRKLLKDLPQKTGLVRRSLSSGTTYYELASEFLISWIQKRQRTFRRLALTVSGLISAGLLAIVILLVFLAFRLQDEKSKAKAAEQRAIQQSKIAQAETLRARKQNFRDNNTINVMAGRLVELSTPQEALFWRQQRANALSELGKHEDAIREYDSILQLDPGNLRAMFGRGFEHYSQREAEEALQDTESYLQKVPSMWMAHQNQGISLSLLGRYEEAEKAFRRSIGQFRFQGAEFGENEVAPDIQKATGRTNLLTDEKLVEMANYYELANLKAYAGSAEFDAVLAMADKQADKEPNSADAALVALDWAWLNMEKRKQDYGALVAQGALWERAGFNEWAKEYYQRFERTHKETKDKRYEGLARWAANRLAALKSYGKPIKEKPSVNNLKFEADELSNEGKYEDARELIDRAIHMAPDDISLYLSRAAISFGLRQYRECKSDCDHVVSEAPNTEDAYVWRALANKGLQASSEIIEEDLRKALEYNPGDGVTMELLSDALYDRANKKGFESSRSELKEALQLLGRSTSAENLSFQDVPSIYYKIARVDCARGDFREAIKPLQTAIAIKDNDSSFYELWREAQKGLGKNEAQVSCSLAGIRRDIAETKFRLGNSGKALDGYWRGLEELIADEQQLNHVEVKQEMAATISKISQIIEHAASRAKAAEFWKTAIESGRWNGVRELLENEEKRLSTPR